MNQPNSSIRTRTASSSVSWRQTTPTTWLCRSTSRCFSPSAATAASTSSGSQGSRGSSSCSPPPTPPWTPTGTRRSTETCTACWSRTLRPTTAGCRRWERTVGRVGVWTSGFLSWFCRNADGLKRGREVFCVQVFGSWCRDERRTRSRASESGRSLFSASVLGCDGHSAAALTEKRPHTHPPTHPASTCRIRVFLCTGQECCNETMPNIPERSDMGESWRERGVCVCVSVCVNVWYACTILGSFFRKDWAACVCEKRAAKPVEESSP